MQEKPGVMFYTRERSSAFLVQYQRPEHPCYQRENDLRPSGFAAHDRQSGRIGTIAQPGGQLSVRPLRICTWICGTV